MCETQKWFPNTLLRGDILDRLLLFYHIVSLDKYLYAESKDKYPTTFCTESLL